MKSVGIPYMLEYLKKQWKWWLPALFLALITPWTPLLDLAVAHYFFDGQHFSHHPFFLWMYEYGEISGYLLAAAAAVSWAASHLFRRCHHWRQGALVVGLTIVLGAGITVNALCKGYLGRPRPKQLIEFGQGMIYRPFWKPNIAPSRLPQKSFPSGHVAMGCSYLTLIVLGQRYRSRPLLILGWALTLFWGPSLMLARVAQGAHFLTDVLISPCLMWWTALIIDAKIHVPSLAQPPAVEDKSTTLT